MSDIEFKSIESNGINLRLAMMGEGPLVIFCHGWPESWYSYRSVSYTHLTLPTICSV